MAGERPGQRGDREGRNEGTGNTGLLETECGQDGPGDGWYQGLQRCYPAFFPVSLRSAFLCGGFFLTSIANGHGSRPPVVSGAFPYNLRNPNFKLWYEKSLIVLVCGRCPPRDGSLWPKSHKQLATPRVEHGQHRCQKRGECRVQEERRMLCKQSRTWPAFPTQPPTFPGSEDICDLRPGRDNRSPGS